MQDISLLYFSEMGWFGFGKLFLSSFFLLQEFSIPDSPFLVYLKGTLYVYVS